MKNYIPVLIGLMFTPCISQAKVTTYFTELGGSARGKRACAGEGNKIVGGQLYYAGGGGKCVAAKKYCEWGMGNRNNCLFPCRDAAVGKANKGKKVVTVPRFKCPFGPLEGKWITKLRVSDVGSAIKGKDIDIFKGICKTQLLNKKGKKTGVCKEYAPNTTIAQYGKGKYQNVASSMADPLGHLEPLFDGPPTMVADRPETAR